MATSVGESDINVGNTFSTNQFIHNYFKMHRQRVHKKTSLETYLYQVGSFKYIIVNSYFFFRNLFFIFKSSLWWTFRVMLSDGVSYFKIRV